MISHMNPPSPTNYLTSEQTGVLLQVSRATVADYLRRGWLRGQRIGRAWRIERASVDRLLTCGPPAASEIR